VPQLPVQVHPDGKGAARAVPAVPYKAAKLAARSNFFIFHPLLKSWLIESMATAKTNKVKLDQKQSVLPMLNF
jgi:hypothetical protein